MALRVLVFDIDCRGKGPYRVPINRAQLVVQPFVLFGALSDLFEQAMRVNTDADVPDHRTDRVEVLVRKLFAAGFSSKQDQPGHFAANNHRQHELNSFLKELLSMSTHEAIGRGGVFNVKLRRVSFEKSLLFRFLDLEFTERLISEAPDG